MGKSFSKFKEDRRKFMPTSSEMKEDQKIFATKSKETALILQDKNAVKIVNKQDTEANAKILAAAEAERLAAYEDLAIRAEKKPILTAEDIENLQLKIRLSPEEFEKHQEEQIEQQIKENQKERRKKIMETFKKQPQQSRGGNNKNKPNIIVRKEILGKERCIYKKVGDRKEYVKHKGDLITVKDYKKIIKARNNKRI